MIRWFCYTFLSVLLMFCARADSYGRYSYSNYVTDSSDGVAGIYFSLVAEQGSTTPAYAVIGCLYPSYSHTALSGKLVIPETLGGYPVREIQPSAFLSASKITSVVLPANLRVVGSKAFAWCTSLTSVTCAGSGLTTIGDNCFSNCVSLKTVTFPTSLQRIGKSVFALCDSLQWVHFEGNAPLLDSLPVNQYTSYFGEKRWTGGTAPARAKFYVNQGTYGWDGPYKGGIPARWPLGHGYMNTHPVEVWAGSATGTPLRPAVTNFVFETVTNVVHTSLEVTNYVHTTVNHYSEVTNRFESYDIITNYVFGVVTNNVYAYSTVTNIHTYIPEPGTSPEEAYGIRAGGETELTLAGAANWDALDLPLGMTWDSETGTLGGTPLKSGTYDLILVSGSGSNTRMMRTVVEVERFDPIIGYVGTSFAWKGLPASLFASYRNLPKGIKWNSTAKTLSGVPTVKGDYSRKTTYGDLVDFRILALPGGATGTFGGIVTNAVGTAYPLVVTAMSAGKITVKVTKGTKVYTLSAANWSSVVTDERGARIFSARVKAAGGLSAIVKISADADWRENSLSATFSGGAVAGLTGSAQRNAFTKNAEAKEIVTGLAGTYSFNLQAVAGGYNLILPEAGRTGRMVVIVKSTGVGTLTGKLDATTKVSASSVVHVGMDGGASLDFFFKGKRYSWAW